MKTMMISLLVLMHVTLAQASEIDPATRFAGYSPTIFENETQVSEVFSKLDRGFKKLRPWRLQFGSECTKRAETWTYDMAKTMQIKSQKVFVFYTLAYHEYYRKTQGEKFDWWFHVAPYVLTKTADGSVQERVLDKTFAEQPQTMKDWTDIFIKSKEACIENVPFKNFEGDVTGTGASYDKNAHCYIVRAPMYDMFPGDIDAREQGHQSETEFDQGQVLFASKALPIEARKAYFKRTGLN